jgi:CRP-like cAMP-binding protein
MTNTEKIFARLLKFAQFRSLPEKVLGEIAEGLRVLPPRSPGTAVVSRGEVGRDFFIIDRGHAIEEGVDAAGHTVPINVLKEGDFFGHFPLLKGVQRATSVVVGRDRLYLLRLDKEDFLRLTSQYPEFAELCQQKTVEDSINRIKGLSFFSLLTPDELTRIVHQVRIGSRSAGDILFKEGETSATLYVIGAGKVHVTRGGRPAIDAFFSAGNFLGELAALENRSRTATATVAEDATLFMLDKPAVNALLQMRPDLEGVLRRKDVSDRLKGTSLFGKLSDEDLATVAWNVGRVGFPKEKYVSHQGEPGSRYYILDSGAVEIRELDEQGKRLSQEAEVATPGYAFGERALFFGQPYMASIWTKDDCQFLFIDQSDFDHIRRHSRDLEKHLNPTSDTKQMLRYPDFPGQANDELVVYYNHRHWSSFLGSLILPLFLILLALIAGVRSTLLLEWSVLKLAIALLVMMLVWAVWNWIEWRNDYVVITTKRVIKRERVVLLFHETIEEAPLHQIQNTRISIGFIGNMLGFYDLTIETVARKIKFEKIPQQPQAQKILHEQMAAVKVSSQIGQEQTIRDKLRQEIGKGDPWEVASVAPTPSSPSFLEAYSKRMQVFRDTVLPWRYRDVGPHDKVWRKHWLKLSERAWLPALLFTGLNALLLAALLGLPPSGFVFPLGMATLILNIPIGFWLWWEVTDWSNDLYIVTPTHVVDVEKKPLFFAEARVQAELEAIQNVSFEQKGVINTLLDIGDVLIETAAAAGKLTFDRVANPREVQSVIFNRMEARRQEKAQEEAERKQKELTNWFDVYHETFADLET